jgi:O-antigen ligase
MAIPGAVVTLSSAAYAGLGLVVVLAIYERLRRLVSFLTWPRLVALVGAAMVAIEAVSSGGLIRVLIRSTLSPQTGYYRLLIWEYGSKSVAKHPWFGIGFDEFERPAWMTNSVDAFWLNIAMRYGLPSAILLGLTAVIAIVGLSRAVVRDPQDRETLVGIAISITVLSILAFTVAFFGGIFIWYFMLLAVGVTLSTPAPRPQPVRLMPVAVRPNLR